MQYGANVKNVAESWLRFLYTKGTVSVNGVVEVWLHESAPDEVRNIVTNVHKIVQIEAIDDWAMWFIQQSLQLINEFETVELVEQSINIHTGNMSVQQCCDWLASDLRRPQFVDAVNEHQGSSKYILVQLQDSIAWEWRIINQVAMMAINAHLQEIGKAA